MDLGIRGRKAIVCGGSAGLGRATAVALAREGVSVVIAARDPERLAKAASDIAAETGAEVRGVVADVTTEAGRAAVLDACPAPDILINNAGGPPPGDFRSWTRDDWLKAIDGNMLSAIFLIQATIDGMIDRRFGRVVNITSHMVKAPAHILGLSNGARAGLTGFVGGLSREVARHNVTLNSVLPGQFDTDRLKSNHARFAQGGDVEAFRDRAKSQIPARRFGEPQEFGDMAAFLCGANAGFITGQNILLDGGQFPGLL
ncbi:MULTISPECIES: SDR family oxidoreductase [Phenylobacterium]|jgi:3-oxoacyl-[acyl-carrier protein] reductase|uniref:SDR family oxidoreductase n=1 Tax=Phenylobacterium conjunctum TaxID=1298959 RepID=A0ABW3SW43_9CAUL